MDFEKDPIPHLTGSLDVRMYDFCVSKWKSSDNTNIENRYNVPITNALINSYLNVITNEALSKLYPCLKNTYPNWSNDTFIKRYQFSGNLNIDRPYKMRDWHIDSGNKVMIGLWYFKHPNDSSEGGLHISNGFSEVYLPYSENFVVFLPNLPNAWHKVGDRNTWTHERRFINIVVEQSELLHDYSREDDGSDRVKPVRNLMI